jgi:polyhydroxyalkanoate synthesis regulator protein
MMRQMMKSWSSTQQQMIDQWLDMVEGTSAPQGAQLWKQTLSVWEASVKRTMEAQNATMNSWMSQMQEVEGMPEEARERVEEGKAIMKQWTETQSDLWEKWFETMRQMDPGRYESNWQEMAEHSVAVWRNYADKIQNLSDEMTSAAGGKADDAES